ncbi:MAG: hypothetical protein ACO1RT_03440 [Planctomycetaceae bacterium]
MTTETETVQTAAVAEVASIGRDDFGPKKRRYGKVATEDGRHAYFQSLTASELAQWDAECLDADGNVDPSKLKHQHPKLLARVLVDKTGKRLFTDDEFQLLADTDSALITTIMQAVRKHVGLDRRIDAEKK